MAFWKALLVTTIIVAVWYVVFGPILGTDPDRMHDSLIWCGVFYLMVKAHERERQSEDTDHA